MSDFSSGVFEVIAADESDARLASRKALVLSETRVSERLGKFLAASSSATEYDARLSYVDDDFKGIIAVACEEVGHGNPEAIYKSLVAHYRPVDQQRTASVHEARRPKMCPYHSEVVDISLGAGDPKAGYDSMAGHAWGNHHCQGDWEGKCGFKREMVTQSFWDDRQKALDKKREERQNTEGGEVFSPQAEQPIEENTSLELTEPITDAESAPQSDDNVIDFAAPAGEIASEPLAMAASQRAVSAHAAMISDFSLSRPAAPAVRVSADFNPSDQDDKTKKVPCPECGGDGETNGGKKCARCKGQGRVSDWGPSTLDAVDSSVTAGDDKKWIQKAVKKPGELHKDLGVPEGEKIPEEKLEEAEHSKDKKVRERVQFAENVKKGSSGDIVDTVPCPACGGSGEKDGKDCSKCNGVGVVADESKNSSMHIAVPEGNTGLGGPEPKIDKRLWTPQNVRKIEVPSEEHPNKEKDPIEPIKAVNGDPLTEIGEKTTEKEELPTAKGLDDSGFAENNMPKGPSTDTWASQEEQAKPVTSKSDDVEVNPVREMLTNDFGGFVAPDVVKRLTASLTS